MRRQAREGMRRACSRSRVRCRRGCGHGHQQARAQLRDRAHCSPRHRRGCGRGHVRERARPAPDEPRAQRRPLGWFQPLTRREQEDWRGRGRRPQEALLWCRGRGLRPRANVPVLKKVRNMSPRAIRDR